MFKSHVRVSSLTHAVRNTDGSERVWPPPGRALSDPGTPWELDRSPAHGEELRGGRLGGPPLLSLADRYLEVGQEHLAIERGDPRVRVRVWLREHLRPPSTRPPAALAHLFEPRLRRGTWGRWWTARYVPGVSLAQMLEHARDGASLPSSVGASLVAQLARVLGAGPALSHLSAADVQLGWDGAVRVNLLARSVVPPAPVDEAGRVLALGGLLIGAASASSELGEQLSWCCAERAVERPPLRELAALAGARERRDLGAFVSSLFSEQREREAGWLEQARLLS
jgi:hypothetical protein